jgi:hypothetical protein
MNATTKRLNSATVWVVTSEAIEQGGVNPAEERERLLDIFERGIPRPPLGYWDGLGSNPVEINIRVEDIDRAVAKWVKVCGDPARVIVIRKHKPACDRFNKVYDY